MPANMHFRLLQKYTNELISYFTVNTRSIGFLFNTNNDINSDVLKSKYALKCFENIL